jgi:GT2 family glycosyltransferase
MQDIDYSKIGLGIITYNSSSRLQTALNNIPDYLENVIIVNDGTPYDSSVYGDRFDVIQHVNNKGVAGAKNSAMRYLYGKGCEHIFLMEDDIVIKDYDIFRIYIEAQKRTGIKHFNYALQGYGNAKRDSEGNIIHPTPIYCVDYEGLNICFYYWCSGPFMYIHRDCIDNVGYFDERFYNIHEHVDYTYRIIQSNLHPPYRYFADIADAHKYIDDGPEFRNTTIPKTENYYERLRGADIYFNIKHGYRPDDIPKSSVEELLLFLLRIKPYS